MSWALIIYLIEIAESLGSFTEFFSAASFIGAGIIGLVGALFYVEGSSDDYRTVSRKALSFAKLMLITGSIAVVATIALPSKETMHWMIAAEVSQQAVTGLQGISVEGLEEIPQNMVNMVNTFMEQYSKAEE